MPGAEEMTVNHWTPFLVHLACSDCILPLYWLTTKGQLWLCHSNTTYFPFRSASLCNLPLLSVAVKSGAGSPTLAAWAMDPRVKASKRAQRFNFFITSSL